MADSALGQDDAWLTAYAPASSPLPLPLPLPPPDQMYYSDGPPQTGIGTKLHPNESDIYITAPKPPPAGDVVLPSGSNSFGSSAQIPNAIEIPELRGMADRSDTYGIGIRETGTTPPRALDDTNALTQASYAGDVLSPYATGNARLGQPSSVENVKDEFARRIQTMVGDMPSDISQKFRIMSGVRSPEWNAEVYRRRGEVAPRTSRHSFGMAVDTTSDPDVLNWINGTNGKYGVDYTLRHLPGEQNHLEMVENGARAPLSSGNAPSTKPAEPAQPLSAAAADRAQEVATDQPSQLHPVFAYEAALEQFPVLHSQQLISGPGKQLEYWAPNEPGTPDRPRPDYIPIDQAGMELGPNSTPMDILGDIVSHHMVKKDPVIKKHFESFKESLTDDQKEQLQAQYNYAVKNQKETRPYAAWEKSTGLPAYFRGYAFGQWPAEFNQKAYTSAQRYHFDRMMDYLRGNTHMQPPSALQ